jgi:hypothetical protein
MSPSMRPATPFPFEPVDDENRPKFRQRRDEFPAVFLWPKLTEGEHQDILSRPLPRKKRQWRRLTHHDPYAQLIWRCRYKLPILPQHGGGCFPGKHNKSGKDLRADRMEGELKLRDHAKISAATS